MEKEMNHQQVSITPTETLEIENGLSLIPRIKLLLKIDPTDPSSSIAKPLDEWQLKRSLIDFLKTSFSVPIVVPEEDLHFKRVKDIKKRKRHDPLGHGALFIRDLGFIVDSGKKYVNLAEIGGGDDSEKFLEWRKVIVEKMNGIELNLVGVKLKLTVTLPRFDDFEGMKKDWEEFYAFGNRGFVRGASGKQQPDTIVLRGVPSRWFAEPRVSSKPSMLVTHTIISSLGKIRNLNVAEDDDLSKDEDEDSEAIVSGLNCKVVAQFETYNDFYNALKMLSGRSLQKQGSRMKVDYEVNWSKEGFFQISRNYAQEKARKIPMPETEQYESEAPRRQSYNSRHNPDNARPKRFKLYPAGIAGDCLPVSCMDTASILLVQGRHIRITHTVCREQAIDILAKLIP